MKFVTRLCDLENKKVVLASQSPRRIDLLRSVGLTFEIYPPKIAENYKRAFHPEEYVRHTASDKAHWVAEHTDYDLIIAADTVVTVNKHLFEKPRHSMQAREMLRELSDRTHRVITGFCLLTARQVIIDHEMTRVTFYQLSDSEIDMYLQTQEPFDKAGAYGIQGFGSLFIRKLEGCYFNVVGFPLGKFYQQLKRLTWNE